MQKYFDKTARTSNLSIIEHTHQMQCFETSGLFGRSPLYMAGRLIDNFSMRRPRALAGHGACG